MDTSVVDQTVKYVTALAPAFTAGFAVQQFVEVIDSLIVWTTSWKPANQSVIPQKKAILSLISVGIATLLVTLDSSDLNVLNAIGAKSAGMAGVVVSVAFISAGTEGFNSIMKWLSYKKEDAKGSAAQSKAGLQNAPTDTTQNKSLDWMPS